MEVLRYRVLARVTRALSRTDLAEDTRCEARWTWVMEARDRLDASRCEIRGSRDVLEDDGREEDEEDIVQRVPVDHVSITSPSDSGQ